MNITQAIKNMSST